MSERTCCAVEDGQSCVNPHYARGWCNKHYQRWLRNGDAVLRGPKRSSDYIGTFWSRVAVRGVDDCWLWTGRLHRTGYGVISVKGRGTLAHRFAYELVNGPIPEGLTIDHLCHMRGRNCDGRLQACLHRRCVNPQHLEAVTMWVNIMRSRSNGYGDRILDIGVRCG